MYHYITFVIEKSLCSGTEIMTLYEIVWIVSDVIRSRHKEWWLQNHLANRFFKPCDRRVTAAPRQVPWVCVTAVRPPCDRRVTAAPRPVPWVRVIAV